MKLVNLTVKEFIDTLASDSPAPGGGSVSALAGANGAGLIIMSGELSFQKKKFKNLDEDIKKAFKEDINIFKKAKTDFLRYIDDDTQAFNKLMDAYRMPKSNDEDKEKRHQAIQLATIETIRVPLKVCQLGIKLMRRVSQIMPYANKNTISDQGVGVMMIHNAIHGSAMNVLINLSGMKDQRLAAEYRATVENIKKESDDLREILLDNIEL